MNSPILIVNLFNKSVQLWKKEFGYSCVSMNLFINAEIVLFVVIQLSIHRDLNYFFDLYLKSISRSLNRNMFHFKV